MQQIQSATVLQCAIFGSNDPINIATAGAFTPLQQKTLVLQNLDYVDTWGGLTTMRSGFNDDDRFLSFHVRQNLGGHTAADRLTFNVAANQRIWVKEQLSAADQPATNHNILQIDGASMFVSLGDGQKHNIPSKLAGWKLGTLCSFASGDATYNYHAQWTWVPYTLGATFTPQSTYALEPNTLNTFRRSDNQMIDPSASINFTLFPYWNNAAQSYGIQRKINVLTQQVIRTVGIIRGVIPYFIIIDDIQRDASTHDYTWLAQMPGDLNLLFGGTLPAGYNSATDLVLNDPATTNLNAAGTNCCLFRVIQALGTPVLSNSVNVVTGSSLGYEIQYSTGRNTLVIERSAVVNPEFIIMVYPFCTATDPIPTTTFSSNVLTVTLGSQVDTITLYPRVAGTSSSTSTSVTVREPVVQRAGVTDPLLDYRNQIEIVQFT